MQEFKGKKINHNGKIFVISSVLKLKDVCSVLGFYEKDGKIPNGSHVVEIKIKLEEIKPLDV